jgi:hypothetical protein
MEKHVLFQLNPWFEDKGEGPFYCPGCASVEGFFRYCPGVENKIDIVHVDFKRPRQEVIALLGAENQGCPVLVLAENTEMPPGAKKSMTTGRSFIDDPKVISDFLGRTFNSARPHP